MAAIGETLRDARMRQNLDIADVESYTKIRAKYLRALENEEWGALPGPTFVRTFLRTYAEAVGIDPHPLVDEYRQRYEPEEETEPPPRTSPRASGGGRPSMPRPPRAPGPPGPLALIGGLAVLIVVALLIVGLVSGDDDAPSSDSAAQTATSETTRTTARRPARKPAPRPRPSGVTVRIAPSEPTYACLDSGDGTGKVFEGILSEARTFKNAKELRVNLGKRQVEITANGKRVEVAPSADPYGLQVTPRAATEITDGQRPCA